jgi:hypothetical protein
MQYLVCDLLTVNLWFGSEQPSRNGADVLGANARIELRSTEHADKIIGPVRKSSKLFNVPSRHTRASRWAIELLRWIEQQRLTRRHFLKHRITLVSDICSTKRALTTQSGCLIDKFPRQIPIIDD